MDKLEQAVKQSYTIGVWTPGAKAYKAKDFSYPEQPFACRHPMQRVYHDIFKSTGLSVFYESFTRHARGGPFLIGRVSLRVNKGIQPFLYLASLESGEKLWVKKEGRGGELEELFDHVAEYTLAGRRETMWFLKVDSVRLHVDD